MKLGQKLTGVMALEREEDTWTKQKRKKFENLETCELRKLREEERGDGQWQGALQLLPGRWKCLGVWERGGVMGRLSGLSGRGELRPLGGSVPPGEEPRTEDKQGY